MERTGWFGGEGGMAGTTRGTELRLGNRAIMRDRDRSAGGPRDTRNEDRGGGGDQNGCGRRQIMRDGHWVQA